MANKTEDKSRLEEYLSTIITASDWSSLDLHLNRTPYKVTMMLKDPMGWNGEDVLNLIKLLEQHYQPESLKKILDILFGDEFKLGDLGTNWCDGKKISTYIQGLEGNEQGVSCRKMKKQAEEAALIMRRITGHNWGYPTVGVGWDFPIYIFNGELLSFHFSFESHIGGSTLTIEDNERNESSRFQAEGFLSSPMLPCIWSDTTNLSRSKDHASKMEKEFPLIQARCSLASGRICLIPAYAPLLDSSPFPEEWTQFEPTSNYKQVNNKLQ